MQPPSSGSSLDAIALVFERTAESLELVERALREQLEGASKLVPTVGEHVLSSGGKRLRPALLVLTAELCGYTGPRRVQIAAAVELLHTATLLHDDVVDLANVRRGTPSVNAIWGNKRAVLAGDFFYARASSMIVEDGNPEILRIFANTIQLMAEGELLQLEHSFDSEASEAHYYKVIERKSATLLGAACECGAVLADVTRAEQRRIAEFGRELGLAFQLRDDALDYEAEEEQLGKARYTDLREGKVTLPLLLALKRCAPAERAQIVSTLKDVSLAAAANGGAIESHDGLDAIVDLVGRYRGVADTVRRAEEHVERAADAIAPFPDGEAKQALHAAAAYSVHRVR